MMAAGGLQSLPAPPPGPHPHPIRRIFPATMKAIVRPMVAGCSCRKPGQQFTPISSFALQHALPYLIVLPCFDGLAHQGG